MDQMLILNTFFFSNEVFDLEEGYLGTEREAATVADDEKEEEAEEKEKRERGKEVERENGSGVGCTAGGGGGV